MSIGQSATIQCEIDKKETQGYIEKLLYPIVKQIIGFHSLFDKFANESEAVD